MIPGTGTNVKDPLPLAFNCDEFTTRFQRGEVDAAINFSPNEE